MSIYERPTKSFMADWAKENLSQGQTFKKSAAIQWFAEHYPKIKSNTVDMHVESMAVNNPVRKHHPSVKPGRWLRSLLQTWSQSIPAVVQGY